MSKSKGNVIDPIDLIDRYGADALRFTLAAMAAQGRDIKLSEARVEGYRNFATKLWNASRFAELNGCARVAGFDPAAAREPLNRWILGEAAKAAAETACAIEAYRFNDAANAAYRFVWSVFCDWHLELAKPVLQEPARCRRPGPRPRRRSPMCSMTIYALLHPFMPFLTEELWAIKGQAGPQRARVRWRSGRGPRQGFEVDAGGRGGNRLDGRSRRGNSLGEIGNGRASLDADAAAFSSPRARRRKKRPRLDREHQASRPRRVRSKQPRARRRAALELVVRGETVALPLAGVVDLAAERARFDKEIARVRQEIAKVEAKLGNADFVARAPEDIIAEHEDRLETFQARLVKLNAARERLERV